MNSIRFFLTRPVFASVVAIFIALFGAIAFIKIPYQLLPQTTRPTISVYTYYPGASPYEIEKEIIQKQEAQLKNLKNLQTLTATMRDGVGIVNLEFGLDRDLRSAFVEVSSKLEEIAGYPDGVEKPIIKTTGESIPVSVYLFVSLKYNIFSIDHRTGIIDSAIDARKAIIENEVLQHYERIPGVGEVILAGGVQPQIQIILNTAQLAYHNITIQEIIDAISSQNRNISAGSIDFEQHAYRIQTIGEFRSAEEIGDTIVKFQKGKITRLSDIAKVQQGYSKKTSYNRHNAQHVLSIQIRPTADANILEMTESIKALTQKLNAQVLPDELEITWGRDQSGFILNAIDQVKQSVLLGMILAIAVLLLFLRNGISLIIVSLVIPLSIIGTFIVLHIFGRTLNIISLAGISFAISMVIDSAIVVLESILRHRRAKPDTPIESTLTGVREVAGALFASSITTIAIFVPIFYLKDEAGQLFADIGIAASSAIVLAFFICIVIIPSFLLLFVRESKQPSRISQKIAALGNWCNAKIMALVALLTRTGMARFVSIAGFLGFCIGFSIWSFPKADYLPKGEQNFIIAYVSTAPGLSYDEKRYIVGQISEQIEPFVCELARDGIGGRIPDTCERAPEAMERDDVPEIANFYIGAGNSISFYLIARDPKQSGKLIDFAKHAIEQVPGVSGVVLRQQVFSGASSSSIDINVSGDDLSEIFTASKMIKDEIKERFSDMNIRAVPTLGANNLELNLYPNDFALLENGLDVGSFGNIVSVLMGGKNLGSAKINDNYMDLVLYSEESNSSPEDILYAPIYAPSGKIIMLGALSEVQSALGVSTIRHFEQKRNALLIVNPSGNAPLEESISKIRDQVIAPIADSHPSLHITLNGNADKLSKLKTELMSGFILAVAIVYLILCALYGSFFYPLLIIASVPLAVTGGLMGLFLTSHFIAPQNLDVMTMLGFIILVGSVVNNAILIIYQSKINFESYGMAWRESVLDATKTRLSPIYMSMLTSVLALLPLVVFAGAGSEMYRGLGAVLIGGLCFSTIVSVFIIPAMLLCLRK